MPGSWCKISLLLVLLPGLVVAQKGPANPSPAHASAAALDYSAEDAILESDTVEDTFQADGTEETVETDAVRVQTKAGLAGENVLRLQYASSEGTGEIVYLRVRKPDGRVIETPVSDAQDVASPETEEAPMYSDIRIRELPVKGAEIGDVIESQTRVDVRTPLARGQFWGTWIFPKDAVVREFRLVVHVPAGKPVVLYSPTHAPEKSTDGRQVTYLWKLSQLQPSKSEADKKKEREKKTPEDLKKESDGIDVAISTFQSWQQLGEWFQKLLSDKIVVTPELKAKADELVQGISGDQDRMRAIYNYVSTNIHYVGIDLGIGRYQPHAAATVLANQYGDCKDKHTLLASLLKAEGYTADAVLINPQVKLVPAIATPEQFDHMITAVEWKGGLLWMDSTPETAPFQMLQPQLRDKDALLIPEQGVARIARTPAAPPFQEFSEWTSQGKLNENGQYTGHFHIRLQDEFGAAMRAVFRAVGATQRDVVMTKLLEVVSLGGEALNVTTSSPENLNEPFVLDFDYTRKDPGDWPNHRIFAVLPVLSFEYGSDDDPPQDDLDLGSAGSHTYVSRITLPSGWNAQLPKPSHYSNSFVEYSNEYTMENGVLVATRKMLLKQSKVKPQQWNDFLAMLKALEMDENRLVQVLAPGETVEPVDENSDPEAERLVRAGYDAARRNDVSAAWQDFDKAEKLNPTQLWLHSGYGFCYELEHNFDQAVDEIEIEYKNHPETATDKVLSDAEEMVKHGGKKAAIRLLQDTLAIAPDLDDVRRALKKLK